MPPGTDDAVDNPLDAYGVSLFVAEIGIQCEMAGIATRQFAAAVNAPGAPTAERTIAVYLAVQSILTCAVKIRNVLWPTYQKPRTLDPEIAAIQAGFTKGRGKQIRKELRVRRQYNVLQSVQVRNAYEHFDERLDRLLQADYGVFLDRNVGSISATWRVAEAGLSKDGGAIAPEAKREVLRHVDPDAGRIYLGNDSWIDLRELLGVMEALYKDVSKWMRAYQSIGRADRNEPGSAFRKT